MQIYKLFATLATHTSISISHQLSTALRHPLSEVFPTPSATTKAQPSSPHAPPTAKEVKASTSTANPSQALPQATLPYYQPLPPLPKAPLSLQARRSNHYMETATQSLALYFIVLRHRTLSPTIYLSEVTDQAPCLIASILHYPAEGKVLFSQRKMLLPVVVFFYRCT